MPSIARRWIPFSVTAAVAGVAILFALPLARRPEIGRAHV